MSNIPSDEEFARAHELSRREWRNVGLVCDRMRAYLAQYHPVDFFTMVPQGEDDFRAGIFFDRESDLRRFAEAEPRRPTDDEVRLCYMDRIEGVRTSEVSQPLFEIMDRVYAELERAGRGRRGEIRVAFEFDSRENVAVNWEDNYFLRLR